VFASDGDGALLSPSASLIGLLVLLGLAAFVSVVNFAYQYDDALITYRMSWNFATGRGFVYNVGRWDMGTTAPLYGLILGVLGKIGGAERIPLFGAIASCLGLTLGGLALTAYGRLVRAPLAGLLIGMFYVTNPMIWITFAGEMPVQMALILWAFVAYRADRRMACSALLAVATLTRPDGVLAAGVIFGYDLVVHRRLLWREWLLFAVILAPFSVLMWIYYGSPIPNTMGAKLAQRDSGLWPQSFGQGLRSWFRVFILTTAKGPRVEFFSIVPGTWSFWATVGVPAVLLTRRFRGWWLPLAWTGLFVLGYRTLKVPFYHHYAATAVVGLSIVTGCGVALVLRLAQRAIDRFRTGRASDLGGPVLASAGAALVLLAMYPHLAMLHETTKRAPLLVLYEEVGRWLEKETPPDSSIGYFEIGYVGYYSRRHMDDGLGLVDPAVPPHVAARDFSWAYRQYRPTYMIERRPSANTNGFLDEDWFKRDYRQVRTFTNANKNLLVLYKSIVPRSSSAAP
jgi:hypothetical protein